MFLNISQNWRENTCARVSILIRLQAIACNFIKKETLAEVFSCEFWEIIKNIFFTEHLGTTTSVFHKSSNIYPRQISSKYFFKKTLVL